MTLWRVQFRSIPSVGEGYPSLLTSCLPLAETPCSTTSGGQALAAVSHMAGFKQGVKLSVCGQLPVSSAIWHLIININKSSQCHPAKPFMCELTAEYSPPRQGLQGVLLVSTVLT